MDGILLINKEQGWTSHDVVAKLRGILRMRQIGHAGTLDPLATGLLLLLLGRATKLSNQLMGLKKTYYAEVTLGAVSETYDGEGPIRPSENLKQPTLAEVQETLKSFSGEILQTPPAYSAKKLAGKKAYELARAGKEVKLEPSKITIYDIKDVEYQYPVLKLRVTCSKGTYLRSLAHDLGQKLGVGGYLSALVREQIGDYNVADALQIGQVLDAETVRQSKAFRPLN